ncbi:hypothetical protein HF673_12440 [Acidithiobacillus thiooxidans]|uniref:hypothetical protein n=1 Tax=Acidithiobacillus thiooxidans TaxID=930 RepID=UPI001C075F46|nr:hypothetical protein [Acidithiobacillus thiooxidans]MBU2836557.1 hypothetical protein [Acidithiobacillus thiooxidans]
MEMRNEIEEKLMAEYQSEVVHYSESGHGGVPLAYPDDDASYAAAMQYFGD